MSVEKKITIAIVGEDNALMAAKAIIADFAENYDTTLSAKKALQQT